jgi:hypothetical protein
MYAAVLEQIDFSMRTFTPLMFRRQIGLYLLRNADFMEPFFDVIKIDEVSYEGWVRGIVDRRLWGDETVLIAISNMWNVSITVVTPQGIYPIYHDKRQPDIVIMTNGPMNKMSHFSSTGI